MLPAVKRHLAAALDVVEGYQLAPQLLYSNEQHGLSAAEFHARCDGESPTVTVLTLDGRAVLGYTTQPWCSDNCFHADDSCFLLELETEDDQAEPLWALPALQGKGEIYCGSFSGPIFGKG